MFGVDLYRRVKAKLRHAQDVSAANETSAWRAASPGVARVLGAQTP
jgi:hypothetical protein